MTKKTSSIRFTDEQRRVLLDAQKAQGFRSLTKFIEVAALEKAGALDRQEQAELVEERIAKSFEALSKRLHSLESSQQFNIALLDTFIKVFVTCVPEPGEEIAAESKSRAKVRYQKIADSVAKQLADS